MLEIDYNQITNMFLWTDTALFGVVFLTARDIYKNKLSIYKLDEKYGFILGKPTEKPIFKKTLKEILFSKIK